MATNAFLFIHTTDVASAEHKRPTIARAFAMRKARAERPWSTRKRPKGQKDQRSIQEASSSMSDKQTRETVHQLKSPKDGSLRRKYVMKGSLEGLEMVLQGEMATYRPMTAECGNSSIGGPCRHDDLQPDSQCTCTACRVKQATPQTQLDGLVDPFGATPVVLDRNVSILLDYFVSAMSPHIFPLCSNMHIGKAHHKWLTASFQGQASLHGVLCLAALHLSAVSTHLQPQQSLALTLRHRIDAITTIQKNLANPERAISDENIAAVFSLLCLEENLFTPFLSAAAGLRPDRRQLRAHLNGLREMIRLRGGVHGLSSSKALQQLIIRNSASRAASCLERAYMIPKDLIAQLHDGYPLSSKYFHETSPMTENCKKLHLSTELVDLVKSTECLVRDSNDWRLAPQGHRFDVLDIHGMWCMMASHVMRGLQDLEDDGRLTPLEGTIGCCLLIFIGLISRSKVIALGAGSVMMERLSNCIFGSGAGVMEALHAANIDVWVGLIAVLPPHSVTAYEEQMWQVFLTSVGRRSSELRTFTDLKCHLEENGLWWADMMDSHARHVWDYTEKVSRSSESLVAKNLESPPLSYPGHPRGPLASSVKLSWSNPYVCGASLERGLFGDDESAYCF